MAGYYPQRELPIFHSLAELRALNSRPSSAEVTLIYLWGGVTPFDGLQGIFVWNPNTTAADDGVDTVRSNWLTNAEAGRWVRQSPNSSGSSILRAVAANYAVLAADALNQATIEVDASAGAVTVTYAIALATGRPVRVAKVDATANPVIIHDGVNPVDAIVAAAAGGFVSSRTVWSNGTAVRSTGI